MWVDFPNRLYDPVKGHALYTRYLSEYVLADKLGFDGLVVNEHHSTAYSMMPACSLIAAALIPQTQRAKICVFGTPVNLEYPNRLAEEYAMLDVMSGGRLELAFPLGTGMEYWANANQLNPATARARFRESMDIVLQAWTQDGPSTFDGEFFNYRYLNVWPKPFQKPHPPIFVVGTGSPSTMAYAAEKGYGYSVVFIPIQGQLEAFAWLREQWRAHGHEPRPDMITFNVLAYVGETDEEAEREGKPHILNFFNNFLRTTPRYLAPPGYVSVDEFRRRAMTSGAARRGELGRPDDPDPRHRRATRTRRRGHRRLARRRWLEQAHRQLAAGRHAALEDGQEPDALCRAGPAQTAPAQPARAHPSREQREERRLMASTTLTQERLTVNGRTIVVNMAGEGEPVVLWHGAGTFTGWDWIKPLADGYRLIAPVHPGYGESEDDQQITSIQDYVMTYLDLFDQLGLDTFSLVGHSLGGWMAATFATQHARRLRKLVLVSPAGLRVPEAPTADLFRILPEELLPMLVADMRFFAGKLPDQPTIDMIVSQFREMTSTARVAWERNYDPKLPRYLHRITVPTLLLWGEQDRLVPVAQAPVWARSLPNATIRTVPDVGHLVLEESDDGMRIVKDFLAH